MTQAEIDALADAMQKLAEALADCVPQVRVH
jgi:hypothetical protein